MLLRFEEETWKTFLLGDVCGGLQVILFSWSGGVDEADLASDFRGFINPAEVYTFSSTSKKPAKGDE